MTGIEKRSETSILLNTRTRGQSKLKGGKFKADKRKYFFTQAVN